MLTVASIAGELVWLVARPLALFFLAIVLAEALAPFVVFLTRWLPRTWAVILLLTLAVVAGIGELIPVLGPLLVTVPIVAVAMLDLPTTALIALVFWIGVQQFETHILSPNVIHSQTDIPPLLVIVAALVGSSVGGFLGALVAIPLSGALRVLVVRFVAPRP